MRTQSICLALAIVLFGPFASAQWVRTNGPYAGNVSCLAVNGTSLFAGTDGSGIFRSTDNGTNWTPVNAGLTDNTVYSLAVIGSSLFAGTEGAGAFRSSDNGTSWTRVNMGSTGGLVYCFSVSGADVFAGTFEGVFHSTGGAQAGLMLVGGGSA